LLSCRDHSHSQITIWGCCSSTCQVTESGWISPNDVGNLGNLLKYPLSIYTLWLFNIAMGNDPFIDGLPIKNCDFPWLC
jgi:hypothetical protein